MENYSFAQMILDHQNFKEALPEVSDNQTHEQLQENISRHLQVTLTINEKTAISGKICPRKQIPT